jgi:hypothetical protein
VAHVRNLARSLAAGQLCRYRASASRQPPCA